MNDYQAPVNPPPLTDENIRGSLFQMDQFDTSQAKATTTQTHAMTAQANWEVVQQANKQVAKMASHIMDCIVLLDNFYVLRYMLMFNAPIQDFLGIVPAMKTLS